MGVEDYSVWVGKWRANDVSVSHYLAEVLKKRWEDEGYDNVVIVKDNA